MSAWVNAIIVDLERGLRKPNEFTGSLAKIFGTDTKTELSVLKINLYLFAGIVGLLTFCTTVDLGSKLICLAVGVAYPVYNLMKTAMRMLGVTDNDVKWLPNWFGFTGFLATELFYDIPPTLADVYLAIKNTFLIWYFLWYAYTILCAQHYYASINSNATAINNNVMNNKEIKRK